MAEGVKIWEIGGKRLPEVELTGPHGNAFHIYVEDEDGDCIALRPGEAMQLIKKLKEALAIVCDKREAHYGYMRKELGL